MPGLIVFFRSHFVELVEVFFSFKRSKTFSLANWKINAAKSLFVVISVDLTLSSFCEKRCIIVDNAHSVL